MDEKETIESVPLDTSNLPMHTGSVLFTLFLIFFLGVSDNQMLSPLMPLMAEEFSLEVGALGQFLIPSYAIAAALSALIVGTLSDRFGRRQFLLYATILFSLSLLLTTITKKIELLAFIRFFTGFAAGTLSTCSLAYVGDIFPYKKRGTAMSIVQAGYFAAMIIGVPVGATVASWYGWRASFLLLALLSFSTILLVLLLLPNDYLLFKEHTIGTKESKLKNFASIFKTVPRISSVVTAFLVSSGFAGFIYYMGSWLMKSFNLNTIEVGRVFIVIGVASLIGVVGAGPISDKFGKRSISILATLPLALTLLLIPKLYWGIPLFITLLVATVAYAFRQGPLQALATEIVPRNTRGTMTAVRTTASQLGIALSTMICGYIYDSFGYYMVGIFSAVITVSSIISIYFMKVEEVEETTKLK
jgi:multidrug resistance protein